METGLRPGLLGEASLAVDHTNLADQSGDGAVGVQVLGTPHLIGLLETAAWNAVQAHLPAGSVTVGTAVAVRHLAATPPGMTVTAHAELVDVDGRRLLFRVWAEDEAERISDGEHERVILPLARLLAKAQAKAKAKAKGGRA